MYVSRLEIEPVELQEFQEGFEIDIITSQLLVSP